MTAMTRVTIPATAPDQGDGRKVVSALCFSVMTLAILQAAVVPVVPTMARQLAVGPTAVGWVVTANLLAAAVVTPVLSRLADQRGCRPVLIGMLIAVVIGSVLCVLSPSLPLLIIGRVMQGAGFALFPIGVAVVRAVLDERRVTRAIGLMSGIMAAGGGLGIVAAGVLVVDGGDYRRVFWMLLVLSLVALIVVWWAIPDTRRRDTHGRRFDAAGTVLIAVALCALLLAIAEGSRWGTWVILPLGIGSCGCFCWWYRYEKRCADPLIPPRALIDRAVTPVHIAAVLVGAAMYVQFLGIAQFVQIDAGLGGYGFGYTVLEASLMFLLPGSVVGVVTATLSGRLISRFRADLVLASMCGVGLVGFTLLGFTHDQPWQIVVAAGVINVFVSGAYTALPSLLIEAVPAGDTAVVNGVNAIARVVGSSLASAVVASLLAVMTLEGSDVPSESAFTLSFVLGGAAAAGAGVCGLLAHTRAEG
ncbi:MFS transporter [Rhodococcus sp. NPDC057014]|uniref:MFS transporter n=1 Tax=Rhodococcus sp. NPDC057014 TaxID=3346000 RepID=UPI00362CA4C7